MRTTTVSLGELEEFSLGRYQVLGSMCLAHIGDSVIPVFAIQGITGRPERAASLHAEEMVDELNRKVSSGRAHAEGAST